MNTFRLAQTTLAVATLRASFASIMMDNMSASVNTVGDAVCDLLYIVRCGMPSATECALSDPSRFSLSRLMAQSASLRYFLVMSTISAAFPSFRMPTLALI